jgi:PAS domain S-box-containing protein
LAKKNRCRALRVSLQESATGRGRTGQKPAALRCPALRLTLPGWLAVALLTFSLMFAVVPECGCSGDSLLTRPDKEWLDTHRTITIAPDPAYPPIEYFDIDGHYQGIAADYVHMVEQKLGIRFRIVQLANWDQALEAAKKREVDMYGAAAMTPQRSEYMLFTSPFVTFPSVIIVRKNVNAQLTLEKLAGMRVAIVSGYADHDYVVNNHPQLDLDVVPSVETGLRKVSFGMVDALVANLGAATYFIEKQGITNLRVAGNTGYVYRLGFGCRKDWPELAAILEKALNDISPYQREAIFKKWVNLDQRSLLTTEQFWISLLLVCAVASAALLGMLVWNRSLKVLVNRRTVELREELAERIRTEEALRLANAYNRSVIEATIDPLVTIDAEGRFSDVNQATEELTGYTRDELIGTDIWAYFKDPEKAREGFRQVFEKGSLRDYELQWVHHSGRIISGLGSASLFRDGAEKAIGICVAVRDITERRMVEEELEKYREHLEELVCGRTAELERANELLQQEINERRQTEHALLESERKLRLMSSQLLTTQEEERKRIARELHDSIGQSLAAIKFNVENVLGEMEQDQSRAKVSALELVIPVVQNAIEEARRIYTGLRPSMLDDLGIIATIGWFCREFQKTYNSIWIEQEFHIDEGDIPGPLKIVIFRIVQEALNNVARHSRAELVNLSLEKKDGTIHLTLEDNGIGFNPAVVLAKNSQEKGLGISGMTERAELANGSFSIFSVLEEGTIIQVSWMA